MKIVQLLEDRNSKPDFISILRKFLPFAVNELELESIPKIKLHLHIGSVDDQPSFGSFNSDTKEINIAIEDRHPLDILRTLAHEMVHYKQNEETGLRPGAGTTGSPEENQAHELAGIVMRNFNKANPEFFHTDAVNLEESKNNTTVWKNDEPKEMVASLTKKLGKPNELTDNRAVWYDKDGFKRIEVKDEYILHCCPAPHYDYVYSTIDLHVPKKFVRVFAESSESILLDLLKNEVSARCATLSANAVTLNYVLDVVSERVQGSKEEYEKRIKQLYKNKLNPDPEWWPDVTKEVRK